MKVSVITPFQKGEHFLEDCLDSIREQGFRDLEVLLVLDHPEEDPMPLIGRYQGDFPIRVLTLSEGKTGVAAARNMALGEAVGEYVYFLDSDDYFYEETLDTLVQAAEESDADLVYGKKVSFWFKRKVFVETYVQPEQEGEEDTDQENGEEDGSGEEGNGSDGGESADGADGGDGAEPDSGDREDEEGEGEEELTEEELHERQKRKACRYLITLKKAMKNISVLNLLIRRNVIVEHHIRFDEESRFYADLAFVVEVVEYSGTIRKAYRAIYVKRKHNDPVNFPALSQIKSGDRFMEFAHAYWDAIGKIAEDGTVRQVLDRKMVQYYTTYFMKQIRRAKREEWRTTYFEEMGRIVGNMDPALFHKMKRYKRKAIKALVRQDVEKSKRLINTRLARRKIKKILRNRRELYKYLYRRFFMKMKLQENWVMLESFLGKNYADSPKNIYEYLQEHYPGKYRFIWSVTKKSEIPFPHKEVKRFGLRYCYYLARCKYFVFNMRQPVWMKKREGSVFLETWHGTPLKKLVFDMEEVYSASPLYKYEVYRQAQKWDYLIAANQFSSDVFRSCFMYGKEMLEYGYPRNDILHAPDREERAAQIRRKLGIPEGKKTILYAPTWRDDEFYGKGQYKFTLKLDLSKMREELGQEYVILLRTHYFIADSLDITGMEDFAWNLSKYDDIADIYLISDICITDYSSVFFDYANLRRPILFYTYDLEKYRDMLRGFYIDIEKEVPGPLLFTTEEVIGAVKEIDEVSRRYEERYDAFYERFCGWEDGHAAEHIAERVFGLDGKE